MPKEAGARLNGADTCTVGKYAHLKLLMQQKGLLHAQPAYYMRMVLLTWAMLATGFASLAVLRNVWFQLLDAAFLAFVFTQIGFIVHDAGHGQTSRDARKNNVLCLIHSNLLLGMSCGWWVEKHNRHHKDPNRVQSDPDLAMFALAISEEQASGKQGLLKWLIKHQEYLFFPLLLLTTIGMRAKGIKAILRNKVRYAGFEAALIGIHVAWYVGILLLMLGATNTIIFIVVHQGLFGLYMGSIFAPNHKGMPILRADSRLDFLNRQILTTRNVKSSPLTDFWYGGLNYQIEHHLFPRVARNKLKETQQIVRAFCLRNSITYYETGVMDSYRAVLKHLRSVSLVAR